jgi:signal transduction histidine kinase
MTPPSSLEIRLAFLQLGPDDLDRLTDLRPTLAAHASSLVDAFYRHLKQFPETASLLKDPATRERLLSQQRSYLLSLADDEIDEAHVERSRQIGRVHAQIGLEPSWYLGAYALYLSLLTPEVCAAFDGDTLRAERTLIALHKRLMLDAQLAIEAYIERHESDLTGLNDRLRRAHSEVRRLFDERGEELRATQKRARAAEELADTATLVAGLAHEIGTPMGVIQGHAKLLERAVDDDKAKWRLRTIQEQIGRISRIIQTLLGMARPSRSAPTDVALASLIDKTLVFVGERMSRHGIEIVREMDPDISVHGDPERLQQVFLNLILNAVDVMEEGGRLYLGLEADGDFAVARVRDDGPGIPPEVREKLFEPFVTTKEAGRGSGLGLAVARGIASDHGGKLALDDSVEQGACFVIRLPLSGTVDRDD